MTDVQLVAPLAGWVLPLTAVPDPVFAEGMMGPGLAIDPIADTLHAPFDGIVADLSAREGAQVAEGVLLARITKDGA